MTTMELEQRLATLESQVTQIQAKLGASSVNPPKNKDWLEKIWGSFADDPAFEEAMRYGRQWREAQRPKARGTKRKTRVTKRPK